MLYLYWYYSEDHRTVIQEFEVMGSCFFFFRQMRDIAKEKPSYSKIRNLGHHTTCGEDVIGIEVRMYVQ